MNAIITKTENFPIAGLQIDFPSVASFDSIESSVLRYQNGALLERNEKGERILAFSDATRRIFTEAPPYPLHWNRYPIRATPQHCVRMSENGSGLMWMIES